MLKENNIYLGDCLELMKEIPDKSINCIVTDPPYKCISGGKPHKKNQPSGILSKNDGKIFKYNNILASEYLPEFYRILADNSHLYLMTNMLNIEEFLKQLRLCGFKIHNILSWKKNNCTPSRWYMKNCEWTIFAYKGKAKGINNPGSKMIEEFPNIKNKLHETQKPVELMQLYINNSSKENDIILDPFAGSFTTAIACIKSNRKFICIEKEEKYFNIGKDRIQKYLESRLK